MNVAGFVNELQASGLELWEDAGRLRFRGPQGAMTAEWREALRVNKGAVLDHLRSATGRVVVTPHPEARHEPFPLTDVQSAYLLGRRDVFAYGGVACHAYGELGFTELDPARMQSAWQRLVRRHDMLRAVVDFDGFQRVLPEVPDYQIAVADLRGRSAADVEDVLGAIRAEMDHEVHTPGEWPLYGLRATLLDGRALLHVSIDFLIADYVSIYLLLDELRELYADPAAQLPDVPITFRDYLLAERGLRQSPRYERDRAFWLARVDDLPAAPELPLLDDPVKSGPVRFRRWRTVLSAPRWQALRATAGTRAVTASGAVLAAYADVVGRWSRQPRFTLDLTLLSRLPLHPDVGRVVGDFTSVDLLEVDRREGATFAERAVTLGGRLFDDLDHRLFTGVEVLREIARRRGPDAALMPVVFTSAVGLRQDVATGGPPRGELGHGISQTPQVWIDCQVMEHEGTLSINWDVREGVFPDGLVDAMFAAFEALLGRLADDAGTWDLADPVELPAGQRDRRAAVNATGRELPDALLHEGFLAAASRGPDRIAVIAGGIELTYADLACRASAVARALRAARTGPGELVAVVADKGWEQVAGVLGVLLAGGAYLPVDTHQPADRRDRILADAGVRHVLVSSTRAEGDWPADTHLIEIDRLDPVPAEVAERRCGPDDLAYVIYTSGSTGNPKGVMISHRAAVNTIDDIGRRFAVGADDRVLGLANLGFDLSVYDVFGVLGAGGTLVLPDPGLRSDPSHWAALVAAHGVTLWNTVPAQLHMLNEYLRTATDDLSSLRLALLSGDWIPITLPDQIRGRLPGLRVISLGGATEASIWSIFHPIGEVDAALPSIPYGTPLANQRFHVLDALFRPCPEWVAGELYIAGDGLAMGYFGDRVRTAERFFPVPDTGERVYRTGDLGRYLPDGTIEFLGRDDRQVKIRGHRIELAEVEAALQADPGVAASAALVQGAPPLDRRLVAFVEPGRVADRPDVDTADLVAEVEAAGDAVRSTVDVDKVVEFARQLDRTALLVMVDVLRGHGLFADDRDRHTESEVMAGVGVAPKHQRLVRRWLAALVEEGLLGRDADGYRALRLVEPADVAAAWREVEVLMPDAHDRPELVHYFQLAARNLPRLLRDEQDPVQLLFPEGSLDIQEAAYMEGFLSRYLNRLATSTLRAIAERHEGPGPLRVLEIGAGVGGTSVEAIPALTGLDVRYLFSDVSQFFLNKAAERFAEHPWVDYALYDMNEPYREQGLRPNSVEVVLCGNVMHYSRDADLVLGRLRELLVAGGWLVFIETTRDNYQILTSMEFLFDATAGDFQDVRHGKDQTFIGREQWLKLLADAGGEVVYCLPVAEDRLAGIGMHVFAARFKTDRARLDEAGVSDRLAARVPAEMVPSRIQVVDELPLTENGKVDRKVLETWLLPGAARSAAERGARPALSDLEAHIAAIWATVLRTPEVGGEDDFYELGGDSLLAAQVVTEIREQVPRAGDVFFDELLRELLNGSTVAGLAALLEDRAPDPGAGPAASALTLVGDTAAVPVVVLVADGLGADVDGLAARLTERGALVTVPPVDIARAGPDDLLDLVAGETARELRALSAGPFQLVGAHSGALLATEIARHLGDSGSHVVEVTAISSYPLPAVVEDDLLAEYLFARGAGADPADLGYPAEADMGRALVAILADSPGLVPADSLISLPLDGDHARVAGSCAVLAATPVDDRLRHLAKLVAAADVAEVRAALERSLVLGRIHATHPPEPYPGDITVLAHTDGSPLWTALREDVERYWDEVCLGALWVREIPGDHFGCRGEPGLAEAITEAGTR